MVFGNIILITESSSKEDNYKKNNTNWFNFLLWNQPNKQTIEETLVLNGVVYDDIKLELVDHIATEIESEASIEGKPGCLKEVFENGNHN
jgi:hypothetical protein